MKRIGWFTTARGPGSLNLFKTMLEAIDGGEVPAEIAFIFINRALKGNQFRSRLVSMAEERNIPVLICPSNTFKQDLRENAIDAWRDAYGKELRRCIAPYHIDFGVLAGYMLILDPETCERYTLINLHPALPETYKGTWEEVVAQVVANDDDRYGATIHVCTPDLDRGGTIAYDSFPIDHFKQKTSSPEELRKMVRAEGVRREAHLLIAAIKVLSEGRVELEGGRVLDGRTGKEIQPPCLATMIDERLRRV